WIRDMPAVHSKSLLRRVQPVGPNHLRQSRVGRRELAIAAVFLSHVEVVRAAEIILGAGSADRRKLRVAVDEKLYLALAPPSAVVNSPRHVGANVLPAARDPIDDRVNLLVRERIHPPELRVEVRRIGGYFGEHVVDLIEQYHRLVRSVGHGNQASLSKRHLPIAIERAAWIYAHRQRRDL